MHTLTVDLGDRSYPIYIGTGLLDRAELYTPHIKGRQVLIVTNETVAPLYLQRVKTALQQRSEEHTSELQSRENLVCRLLLEKKKKTKVIENTEIMQI